VLGALRVGEGESCSDLGLAGRPGTDWGGPSSSDASGVYVGLRGDGLMAKDGDETLGSVFDAEVDDLRCIMPAIAAAGLSG
jgi:hypothetical protein